MNKKTFVFFLEGFLLINFVLLSQGVSADQNSSMSLNATVNETGQVINYTQTDFSLAEFEVAANISATQWWTEISLNTSKIDFGYVERGKSKSMKYRIQARGTIDINVTPILENEDDEIFSNLYFSRTTTGWKKIGNENLGLIFNLTKNKGLWTVIGASDAMKNLSSTDKGEQNIKLDLTNFKEIVPFDEIHNNTVKFVITPIWSSVEPIVENN